MQIENKRILRLSAGIFLLFLLPAHSLFIKLDCYTLSPHTESLLCLYNGDFINSRDTIPEENIENISICTPDGWMHPSHTGWLHEGNVCCLNFKTGSAGTCVAGVSTSFSKIDMDEEEFGKYLEKAGLLNIIDRRKREGSAHLPASWLYAKHAKAVFQVGNDYTDDFLTTMGYPVEIIPMYNPYLLKKGDELSVRLLVDGEPMGDQWVYAGYEKDGEEITSFSRQTDHRGTVNIPVEEHGRWFVRSIYMTYSIDPDTDYEAHGATLSFEIF